MDAWEMVIADMKARRESGVSRYGKGVDPADRSEDWMQHAYEEALDLAVYLKAHIERRKTPEGRGETSGGCT